MRVHELCMFFFIATFKLNLFFCFLPIICVYYTVCYHLIIRSELLTSAIGGVARSKWAQLLVLQGARQGAELALGPPASTCVAAALRLGDTEPVGGRLLAHCL